MVDLSRAPALRRCFSLGFSTVLLGLLTACAETPAPVTPSASGAARSTSSTRTVEVAPIVVSPFTDSELEGRFEKARALLLADKYKEAAPAFDALVRLAPDGAVAAPSLYNGALAHEGLGARAAAAERYTQLLQRFPQHATARGALFRLSRLDAFLERWSELVTISDRILALPDLTVIEAIEAHGARGLGLIEQDKLEEAAHEVGLARDMIEKHRIGDAGAPPIELATVSFALGEVRRKKSEKIALVPVTPSFAEILEQRCQALLDAQNAYTDAMRSFDAHWSAMAGYRVGQLYQTLHRDVMAIPPTAKSDTLKKKQLFEGAMRLRYRVLLEKGLKMMEGTVRIGQRTGEDSAWVHRADEAKRDIERALEDEKAALSKLPFTEAELTEALEKLKKPVP